MRRYCAMVVVKPPELERIAIDPFFSVSPGLSPPRPPPRRTWFHESATPRQFAPKMSTPFCWPIARISRASCTEIFSVMMKTLRSSGFTRMSSATPSRAAARLHPRVHLARVVDDLAHRRIEAEEPVGEAQHLAGVAQGSHAAHEVGPAAAGDDVERRRAVPAEVLAQRVGHRTECLEDVG